MTSSLEKNIIFSEAVKPGFILERKFWTENQNHSSPTFVIKKALMLQCWSERVSCEASYSKSQTMIDYWLMEQECSYFT